MEDWSDSDDEHSDAAPPFSPISSAEEEESDHDGGDDDPPRSMSDDDDDDGGSDEPECDLEELVVRHESRCTPSTQVEESDWFGFKFVGDNIDKNIKPSFQRQEIQTQSLHHFHGYAIRDRVNMATMSDDPRSITTTT